MPIKVIKIESKTEQPQILLGKLWTQQMYFNSSGPCRRIVDTGDVFQFLRSLWQIVDTGAVFQSNCFKLFMKMTIAFNCKIMLYKIDRANYNEVYLSGKCNKNQLKF